jgi:hypothetical protein
MEASVWEDVGAFMVFVGKRWWKQRKKHVPVAKVVD